MRGSQTWRNFLAMLGILCGAILLPAFPAEGASKKVALRSSVLTAATYDEKAQTLEVEFRSGAVYRYLKVPRATYEKLIAAQSKGRFFSQNIRNDFTAQRVR